MDYKIRKAEERDSGSISDVFNYFIENSYASYETSKTGPDFHSKIKASSPQYPFYVIETSNLVIGFGFLRPFRNSETFRRTAEITYFILPEHTRKGLGTKLLQVLERKANEMNITTLLANVSSLNNQSLEFHLKNGFRRCGTFRKIGRKFGKNFDVVWMQKSLKDGSPVRRNSKD
jgi:L-amino acid N-acyltransferase YncA